ncbi:TPA: carbohydrate ABC transporter permease [Klebsiella pneumoniae]|uniref:carbohydrate ABC transporter permease n=1 Tax=Klebsiella pneumoniae TaxID=573 RepID=UPI003006AF22
MSAEISPLLVRTPAAARPLWLRLRRSSPFTLTVLMCCLALLWVSPFIWMLATSFSATTFGDDMASLLPRLPLTLDNFRDAWQSADWLSLYTNTLIFTFGTFFVQLLTITTAGYVFACHEFRGKQTLFLLFLVQLMIMPVVMMVPNMLTLKTFGLLNTLTGVMMPYFTSAFGVFLMRQAFLAIPKELEEAALMEGCRWWQVLTVGLVSFAMGAESGGQWGTIGAGTLMVCLPLMLAFILFQKQFLRSFGFSGIK